MANNFSDEEIKVAIFNKVKETVQFAFAEGIITKANLHKFGINYTLTGVTAGYLRTSGEVYELNFNLQLCRENFDDFINQTVGHEVAHLIQYSLHAFCKHHGKEWKTIMFLLDLDPDRCHNYNVQTVKHTYSPREYKYVKCPVCFGQVRFSKPKYNALVNKNKIFRCGYCHSNISAKDIKSN